MAAIDFPASPTTGQTFTALNGVIYQYDGVKWVVGFSPTGMVAFKTNLPNALSVPNYTSFTITWSSVAFNNGGGLWDGTTYTVKTAGLYDIEFCYALNWPASGGPVYVTQGEAYIVLNGTTAAVNTINHAAQQGPLGASYRVRWVAYLNVNDTLKFSGFAGNANTNIFASQAYTCVTIIRLGG